MIKINLGNKHIRKTLKAQPILIYCSKKQIKMKKKYWL